MLSQLSRPPVEGTIEVGIQPTEGLSTNEDDEKAETKEKVHPPLGTIKKHFVQSQTALATVQDPIMKAAFAEQLLSFTRQPAAISELGVPMHLSGATQFRVGDENSYGEGGVPELAHSALLKEKDQARSDIAVLPHHINKLFHKIMGWSKELGTLDDRTGLTREPSPEAIAKDPSLALAAAQHAKKKLQYGALMDRYEADDFALKHNLQLAGSALERKLMNWQGLKLLDRDFENQLNEHKEHKTAMIVNSNDRSKFKIPRMNADACPGCGATMQDTDQDAFGYISPDELTKYIIAWQRTLTVRQEYADRMYELQSHWAKHGKRVGEEWLDFMTEEEFRAIYRWQGTPCFCHRCYLLRKGTLPPLSTLSAPDFSSKLHALREKRCLIVLVVDLTDFPGSMVPDLPGLISMNNPVLIAANKLDCIMSENFGYKGDLLNVISRRLSPGHIAHWVREQAVNFRLPDSQIKHVVPVSAKRRWNIENLVDQIEHHANFNCRRDFPPLPVYFVGATNVGKSRLLNAVAEYLYVEQAPFDDAVKQFFVSKDAKTGVDVVDYRWVRTKPQNDSEMVHAPRDVSSQALFTSSALPGTTVDVQAIRLSLTGNVKGRNEPLLYDTPGIHPHWFTSSPITVDQIPKTLQRRFKNPDFYILTPGSTFFLSGYAAIDVVKGPPQLLFAVYTSRDIRSTFCATPGADELWSKEVGGLLWPPGSPEQIGDLRLTVKRSYLFECYQKHKKTPKADVYFCGLGWVSFCTSEQSDVVLRVRTLPGIVHGIRPPLRFRDIRPYRPWPRLPRSCTTLPPKKATDTIFKLTHKPFDPNGPAQKIVLPTVPVATGTASSAPFDFIIEELKRQGKLQ